MIFWCKSPFLKTLFTKRNFIFHGADSKTSLLHFYSYPCLTGYNLSRDTPL